MKNGNPFGKKASKKVEFSLSTIQANPVMQTQLEGFVDEIILWRGKQKEAAGGIGDIRHQAKDTLGIPGKMLMKLVREKMDEGALEAEMEDLKTIRGLNRVMNGELPTAVGDDADE